MQTTYHHRNFYLRQLRFQLRFLNVIIGLIYNYFNESNDQRCNIYKFQNTTIGTPNTITFDVPNEASSPLCVVQLVLKGQSSMDFVILYIKSPTPEYMVYQSVVAYRHVTTRTLQQLALGNLFLRFLFTCVHKHNILTSKNKKLVNVNELKN